MLPLLYFSFWHWQNTVTLHHLGSLTHLKADGDFYTYSLSGDNSNDLILYAHSAQNEAMDFLLDGMKQIQFK